MHFKETHAIKRETFEVEIKPLLFDVTSSLVESRLSTLSDDDSTIHPSMFSSFYLSRKHDFCHHSVREKERREKRERLCSKSRKKEGMKGGRKEREGERERRELGSVLMFPPTG